MEDDDGQTSPSRHAHWRLVDRDGGFFILPESVTLLGREGCHIATSSRSVDLKHAIISFDYCTSCFKIKDLSSLNGTYVNDTRIPEQTYINLNHGDHLRLGYDATVYRVEFVACSPQGFVQYLAADAAVETAGGRSASGSVDFRWAQAVGQADKQAECWGSRPPLPPLPLPVAECQGCIKEQLLHHTCDDNAEDARQAGLCCDGSRMRSGDSGGISSSSGGASTPSGERVVHLRGSPVLAAVTVVNRPTWDRKDSPDYAAASALPWLLPADFSSGTMASEQVSVLRKSYSMPEDATPASPLATVAAAATAAAGPQPGASRGTPLYGQPDWWGEHGGISEDSPVAEGAPARSQRPTQWHNRAADAAGDYAGRSERMLLSASKPSAATRPASLQTEQAVAHAVASGDPEMTSVAYCQANASTASPGKSLEPVMPGTAFTVNFDNASYLSQGEDAVSPKMGDSLSRFMPEQLRQSLRKRHKKTNKEPTAADESLVAGTSGSPSDAVSSLTQASVKPKKDRAHKEVAPAVDSSGDVIADLAAAAMACTSEKNLKARAVPSSVAFLMRKMYGNGSEDAAGGNNDDDDHGDDNDEETGDERVYDGARDDAISEAGTYTVDVSDAARRHMLADGQFSDNDLSSLDSGGDVGAAQPRPSSPQLLDEDFTSGGRRPASARLRLASASPVMSMAVGQQSTFDTGLPIRDDLFHSSLDVEVGRWHADSNADENSSCDVLRLQSVTLSKPGGKDLCSSPVTSRGVLLGRGAVGSAAPNAAGSRPSPPQRESEAPSSIAVDRRSPTRSEQELAEDAKSPTTAAATATMFAGMVDARSSIISPVEHDTELLLNAAAAAARADDSPAAAARRARREAAGGELSKARLLQELGIGDEPVQPVAERPKLVQELLSSRKHHREDDPVIVSSSKNFFEKIRPKGDAEPGSRVSAGKPPPHHPAHVERTGVNSAETDAGLFDGAGDAAAAPRASLAGGQGDHWAANGHHGRHSPAAVLSDLHDSSGRGSPGGSSGIRHQAADPLATQLQINTSSRVTVARRHNSPPQPDSPRDGDESAVAAMTSRTDATVRTELLLRPTEEFVRSMSAKHGSGNRHRRSEPSGLDTAALLASRSASDADFESAVAESGRGDGSDREGAATWSDGRCAEPTRLDSRPPLRQTSAVAAASSVTQSRRRPGGDSLGGAVAGGSLRGLTGEAVMMSLTSRSGRSSADSLASRESSDGSALLGAAVAAGAGRAAKERAAPRAAESVVHARHVSDSSALSSSVRVAQLAAAAATEPSATAASVGSASQQRGSSARPNRTFELRRARTLAAPEVPSERSSARSSTTDSSSGIGKPRSRSGSLERASEVSLGARIVQRSRQSAATAGGGGAGSSTAGAFSAEVRGAKLPLAAKSTAPSSGSTFARSDGGRYSMRVSSGSGSASAAAAAAASGKVDQRSRKQAAGVSSSNGSRRKSSGADLGGSSGGSTAKGRSAAAALLSSQAKAELEREKAAWERRRSYDPRRAAALGSTSGTSSVSSTPRQTTSSLGSRASSGTSSPVTPIALRQQQPPPKQLPLHYAQPPPLLLDSVTSGGGDGSSAYASPLVTASSSRRGSAGTAGDDADDYFEGCDDDGSTSFASGSAVGGDAAMGDYDDDEGNEQVAEDIEARGNSGGGGGGSCWRRSSDPSEDPTRAHRLHGHGGRAVAVATAVSAAKHELQIAKMSSELAKDLELLSRGAAGDEEPDNVACDDGRDGGHLAAGRWPHRHDSAGGGSSGDEMASSVDGRRDLAGAAALASRLVHDVSSCGADDGTVPNTSRSCYADDTASDATERPDSCSGKSAFTSYSAFTEPGVTPQGKANSPALSPVKKKVVEAQSEENGGSPQIPDQNYDGVMVSSIKHISNRLSKSTSRILTRLREKLDLSSAHSSEEEAEAADRAAETLLGDHGVTELPGSQELAAALRTLRRAERNVRAVERALFTNDSYPEITPTVTTHERDHYLAEIKRIRDEITGFKPITSAPTLSTEDAKKVTAVASLSASVATTKVLTTKPAGFTTVKSLTSLKKTYY